MNQERGDRITLGASGSRSPITPQESTATHTTKRSIVLSRTQASARSLEAPIPGTAETSLLHVTKLAGGQLVRHGNGSRGWLVTREHRTRAHEKRLRDVCICTSTALDRDREPHPSLFVGNRLFYRGLDRVIFAPPRSRDERRPVSHVYDYVLQLGQLVFKGGTDQ